jgi:hypothetical protein
MSNHFQVMQSKVCCSNYTHNTDSKFCLKMSEIFLGYSVVLSEHLVWAPFRINYSLLFRGENMKLSFSSTLREIKLQLASLIVVISVMKNLYSKNSQIIGHFKIKQ